MKALVVADGDVPKRAAIERLLHRQPDERVLVVVADGGARKAQLIGLRPEVVVGDGDSLPPDVAAELRADGVEVIVHLPTKDESDTELAVREAVQRGATSVVVVGAFGGLRIDHTLANLLLLALPELAGLDICLADSASVVRVIGDGGPATLELTGTPGDYVSLLALSERVEGLTTTGLSYPLNDETLLMGPTRGLSNELAAARAAVTRRSGRLAVIHTRKTRGAAA